MKTTLYILPLTTVQNGDLKTETTENKDLLALWKKKNLQSHFQILQKWNVISSTEML